MKIAVNLNDVVYVKMTERGRNLHRKKTDAWNATLEPYQSKAHYQPESSEGWSRWTLWELMAEFGDYLRPGDPLLFETEIIIDQ